MNKTKFRNHIFIAGCARSGTTALTRILNSHDDIYLSTEKFNSIFLNEPNKFDKSIFKLESFNKSIVDSQKSRENLKYIGDKFPGYYRNYKLLFEKFPKAHVLFLFRNIFDVAQSYKARKLDEKNKWEKGVGRAITEWNISLENTIDSINNGQNISALCYEDILFNPSSKLENILKIKRNPKFYSNYKKMTVYASKLELNKTNILTSREKIKILSTAKFDLYKTLLTITKSY